MKKVVTVALIAVLAIAHVNIDVRSAVAFTGFSEYTNVYNSNGEKIASVEKGERFVHEGDEDLELVVRGEIAWDHFPVTPKTEILISIRKLTAIKPEYQAALAVAIGTTRSRRIMLNYPPVSSVWHLPSGVSQLTAVLRNDGHDVVQRYGHIIGLEYLLRKHGGSGVEWALKTIRDPNSDIGSLYRARMIFETVSRSISTDDQFAVVRNNVSYVSAYYDGSIEGVVRGVRDRERHLWHPYFNDVELRLARDSKPDIYGISIADERQIVQGLILASMIKDAMPDTIVVLGGNFWSRVIGAYQRPSFRQIFSWCDVIVYAEGFQPLRTLTETMDPRSMPGSVWCDNNRVIINPISSVPTEFQFLPTPVFDGGARQWSPYPVYPLYTMSNCPMACRFCAISAGSDTYLDTPRSMKPSCIAQHIARLGGGRFDIVDETFPIGRQLQLGAQLQRLGHAATWQCYLTVTDRLLDPAVSVQLYEAGCRGVQLGLETLFPSILDREEKRWNRPEHYAQILRNLRNAGIQTHVFLLIGLPGQPLNWDLRWLGFLEEHGDSILTIKAGRYRLSKRAPENMHGTHSGFVTLLPDDKPLHLNRGFQYNAVSRKRVEAVRDILEQMCRNHWAYGVTSTIPWWINRGRYTLDELRAMAALLPPEQEVRHLERSVRKMNGIVYDELDIKTSLTDYRDLAAFTKTI
ncbi:MAG: radical SAM protein [Patescibacteria group bacterium]